MTQTIPLPRSAAEAEPRVSHRWLALAILGVAQLMVVLDATIMNVALPSAQRALGFSDADRQWVVTAYALSFGSLLLLGGRLGDLIGRRATFMIGLVGFATASAVGGAAQNFAMLASARAAQGVFAALLAPAALGLLTTTFTDPKERAKAFGIFSALAGTGGAIGLLLGGALTTYASWRWALYINLGFAAIALFGTARLLPRMVRSGSVHLDWWGTLTASAGLFSLVYGISHAETAGWADGVTVGSLVVSALLLVTFAWTQTKVEHPLLPPRVVLDRNRAGSYLAMLVVGSGMFAVFLFLTYYLQQTVGFSAIRTGIAFLPMVAALVAAAQVTALVLLRRLGARILIPTGMAIAAVGLALLARIGVDTGYATHVLPGLIVMGLGIGVVFATAMQTAIAGVEHRDAGVASAMVNTVQQVGGSIGVALLGTIAGDAVSSYLSGKGVPTPALLQAAAVHSYTTTFWWAAGILAIGAGLVGAVLPSGTAAPVAQTASTEPVMVH
ncbi:MAG TPA: MFS transporter [Sporichthyaceae bacterium]|jgi:EmrB/QacA subfamily drug resistance transporter|nr:MFS transporter [Sporichthyaceae bacterium]